MTFHKVTQGKSMVVIGKSDTSKDIYPPGFRYQMGNIIYTVVKDVTQDSTAIMREVVTSDGSVEILPIEVIQKDIREKGCKILDPDKRYMEKLEAVDQPEEKTVRVKKNATQKKKNVTKKKRGKKTS